NAVVLVGHVKQADEIGHFGRLQEDVAAMKARGVTGLDVTVVPGDATAAEGRAIPHPDELSKHFGEDVGVNVIPRPNGEESHTHVAVTKDGLAVYEGKLSKNNLPDVLATHAFPDAQQAGQPGSN